MQGTLYIASSLNGLMTRGEQDSEWVSPADEDSFTQYCTEAGFIVIGRKTFEQYLDIIYPLQDVIHVVLSSTPLKYTGENVHHAQSIDESKALLQRLHCKRFIVAGGSAVIGEYFKAGLINEVLLSIHPYIFSSGLPTFGPGCNDMEFEYVGVEKQSAEMVLLKYKCKV